MTTKATNSVLNLVSPPIDDMVLLSGTLDNVVIGANVPNVARFTFATITNVNNTVVAANGSGTLVGITIGAGLSYNPGTLTLTGITDINDLTGNLDIAHGGTGRNFLNHGVLIGEGSSPIDSATPGAAGTVLISNGPSNDPFFGNLDLGVGATGILPIGHGGTGQNFLTPNSILVGNGASPVGFTPFGSAGLPLVSNGPGILATFQTVSLDGGVSGTLPYGSSNNRLLFSAYGTGANAPLVEFFTVPADTFRLYGLVVGGGGAGAGVGTIYSGGGGGAGGLTFGWFDVTPSQVLTVTIGNGGNAQIATAPGNDGAGGASSSIAGIMSADGGTGGVSSVSAAGGISGEGHGGTVFTWAGDGGDGSVKATNYMGGNGGCSYFGGGTRASTVGGAPGFSAPGSGGGGGYGGSSGVIDVPAPGAAGADGAVLIYG